MIATQGNANVNNQLKTGLKEALQLLDSTITSLPVEEVALLDAADRILGEDIRALVDSPSVDASLKDGYAVLSEDIATASEQTPVSLKVLGTIHAGATGESRKIVSGTAIKVLTGAEVPVGAQGIVSEEFTTRSGSGIKVLNTAEPGRNILIRGSDVKSGEIVASKGQKVTPGLLGLIAAAGHSRLKVIKSPKVAIIATGDEVVSPGIPLPKGKLYASNITCLAAWCRRFDYDVQLSIVNDRFDEIEAVFSRLATETDAIITSGGAWTGDHDLVARVLDHMDGRILFHRLRIGPGKATGMAMLAGIPVFILPGGPPSNLMGFLQIALPGLFMLSGAASSPLPRCKVRIREELRTNSPSWTQFIYGRLTTDTNEEPPLFLPLKANSRLRSMAEATAVVSIAEGEAFIAANSVISAQLLT
jgi:molybdopterin molybdotransferase